MGSKTKLRNILNSTFINFIHNRALWTVLFLLIFFSISCASGSGKFYNWCEKRDFPAICKKYFD